MEAGAAGRSADEVEAVVWQGGDRTPKLGRLPHERGVPEHMSGP
jgi:hypothetical protein